MNERRALPGYRTLKGIRRCGKPPAARAPRRRARPRSHRPDARPAPAAARLARRPSRTGRCRSGSRSRRAPHCGSAVPPMRDDDPRQVDRHHEHDRRDRVPRRIDRRLRRADEVRDRAVADRDRDEHEERGLTERPEVLGLAVAVLVARVGRAGATPTAKKVSSAATRSVPECAASERRPRLWAARPTPSFSATSAAAAPTETSAVLRCGDIGQAWQPDTPRARRAGPRGVVLGDGD